MAAETTRRMGQTDGALYLLKKVFYLLVALFMLSGITAICDELGALKIYKARLPIYNRKELKYMVFSAVMTKISDKIFAEEAIIDLIKKNVDVDKIIYLEDAKPYKLGTSPADVAEFWKDKTTSLGFISSSRATILQESQIASGDKEVFFRSPKLDLNGVGFVANFDIRIIKVLKEVDLIIRMKTYQKGVKASKNDIIKVKADSMIMDLKKEFVTFIGNVKVDDADFDIFCSRMEVDLRDDADNIKSGSNGNDDSGGISKISCFGNVKIFHKVSAAELKKNGEEKAFAEKAVYLKAKEQFILSGKNSRIYRGDNMISGDKIIIWKDSGRLQAFKNCLLETGKKKTPESKTTKITSDFMDFEHEKNLGIFTGHVRVKDAAFKLNCYKMMVYLAERKKKKPTDASKKELTKIICTDSVSINDPRARVNCERMVITFKDIVPGSKKTDGAISDTREVDLIKCFDSVNMYNKPKEIDVKPTIINSDKAVLNIRENVADLYGKVKIEEERFYLNCKKMKILAKDVTPEEAAANAAENLEDPDEAPGFVGIGNSRELTKIICLEDVVMTRRRSDQKQEAKGDKGVYVIRDHMITLTDSKGRPTLQRGPNIMEGSKVIMWTNSEQLDIEDGTLKSVDGSGLLN